MKVHPSFLLGILIVVCSAGCAEMSFIKSPVRFVSLAQGKIRKQQAARILCLWEAAEGLGLDGRPCSGFAGQILFFGSATAAPIPVHGTVRIYEYENFNPDDVAPKPIHVFVFDDAGWNAHRTESTVGESYNVFLPCVTRPSRLSKFALKVEFVAEDSRSISSPVTEITLGPEQRRSTTQSTMARKQTIFPVTVSSQPKPAMNTSRVAEKQLESLTIRLPRIVK